MSSDALSPRTSRWLREAHARSLAARVAGGARSLAWREVRIALPDDGFVDPCSIPVTGELSDNVVLVVAACGGGHPGLLEPAHRPRVRRWPDTPIPARLWPTLALGEAC